MACRSARGARGARRVVGAVDARAAHRWCPSDRRAPAQLAASVAPPCAWRSSATPTCRAARARSPRPACSAAARPTRSCTPATCIDVPVLELLRSLGPPVHAISGNVDSAAVRSAAPRAPGARARRRADRHDPHPRARRPAASTRCARSSRAATRSSSATRTCPSTPSATAFRSSTPARRPSAAARPRTRWASRRSTAGASRSSCTSCGSVAAVPDEPSSRKIRVRGGSGPLQTLVELACRRSLDALGYAPRCACTIKRDPLKQEGAGASLSSDGGLWVNLGLAKHGEPLLGWVLSEEIAHHYFAEVHGIRRGGDFVEELLHELFATWFQIRENILSGPDVVRRAHHRAGAAGAAEPRARRAPRQADRGRRLRQRGQRRAPRSVVRRPRDRRARRASSCACC